MLIVKSFKGGYDSNFSYLVWDDSSKEGVVIDTALDPLEIFEFARDNGVEVKSAVVMHSHFDHTVKLEKYKGVKLYGHRNLQINVNKVNDGDYVSIGSYKLEVLHCPGHTEDSICLLGEGKLFTSDVLFIDGCGRCDLVGGDSGVMWESLMKIMALHEDTIIYPGHDYGPKEFDTLANQKKTNYFLTVKSEREFVEMR